MIPPISDNGGDFKSSKKKPSKLLNLFRKILERSQKDHENGTVTLNQIKELDAMSIPQREMAIKKITLSLRLMARDPMVDLLELLAYVKEMEKNKDLQCEITLLYRSNHFGSLLGSETRKLEQMLHALDQMDLQEYLSKEEAFFSLLKHVESQLLLQPNPEIGALKKLAHARLKMLVDRVEGIDDHLQDFPEIKAFYGEELG